jgi:hypothetical protein
MIRLGGKQDSVKEYDKRKEGWGNLLLCCKENRVGEGLMREGAEGG